jgi:hypothetical protein
MKCAECGNEVRENAGTSENPLCRSCYDRMKQDHAADNTPTRDRRKFTWVVPAVVVLLIFSGGLSALYVFSHTPSYALRAIASAIEDHDWKKFTEYVDVESFYSTTVKGALENTDNVIAKGIGTLMASNMKEAFIDQLKTQIEQPKEGTSSLFHQLFDKSSVLLTKMSISDRGKIVQVRLPRKTEYLELEVPVIFNFRKGTVHLTLTSMDMTKFDKAEKKIEEILSEHFTLPVADSLKRLVTVETVRKYKGCGNWVYETCFDDLIMITSRVTNHSNEDLEQVSFEIYPGTIWEGTSKKKYQDATNIGAGQAVLAGARQGWKYNQFDEDDQLFMNADMNDICYRITKIVFKDGRTIEENKYDYMGKYSQEKPTLDSIIARRAKYGLTDEFTIRKVLSGEDIGGM